MDIKTKKIDELIMADYNPRIISGKVIKDLKKSIEIFGFLEPIIVNIHPERKNIIIGGHARYLAAKQLNKTDVPCLEVNLDKQAEKVLNLALNKIGGKWDHTKLAEVLHSFISEPTELVQYTGFSEKETIKIIDEVARVNDDDPGIPSDNQVQCPKCHHKFEI